MSDPVDGGAADETPTDGGPTDEGNPAAGGGPEANDDRTPGGDSPGTDATAPIDDDDHVDPEDESFRAELGRRVFHVSGAVVPVAWAVGAVGWRTVRWLCVAGAVAGLAVECARLVVGLDWAMFDRLTRGYEQDNLAGYALYLIGGAVAAWVYAPRVAAAALLMLTVADPVSGLAGSGELRRVKPLPILLVTFGTSLVLAAPLLPLRGAVPAAAGATVADGVKPIVRTYVVDDNLTIPLVAGAAGTIGLAV